MAGEDGDLSDDVVYYEDWTGNEPVILLNTVPPANVTNLTATNVQATTLTLTWTASTSPNVAGYDVFNGDSLIGQTSDTALTITGLTPSTAYTFKVKTRGTGGLTSSGAVVSVTTPVMRYALAMNGTSDYMWTPDLIFDTVVLDISVTPRTGVYSAYVDASRSVPQSAVGRDSIGRDFLQPAWRFIFVDGIDKTGLQGTTALVPSNRRTTLKLTLKTSAKATVCLFANQLGSIPMKGVLYGVQFMLGTNIAAAYDFTVPFAGNAVPDASGNNKTATLKGGTWINW